MIQGVIANYINTTIIHLSILVYFSLHRTVLITKFYEKLFTSCFRVLSVCDGKFFTEATRVKTFLSTWIYILAKIVKSRNDRALLFVYSTQIIIKKSFKIIKGSLQKKKCNIFFIGGGSEPVFVKFFFFQKHGFKGLNIAF